MPGMIPQPFHRALLAPRQWPAWLAWGLIELLGRLPYPCLLRAGHTLGGVIFRLFGSRRRVARRNIELCFPELNTAQQAALTEASMRNIGLMVAEFAMGWALPRRDFLKRSIRLEGAEHLAEAEAQGRGVLLVGSHISSLELAARYISEHMPTAAVYREMDSAVFEREVLRARMTHAEAMFERDDLRGIIRYLRKGGRVWYAPDQEMRHKETVFAPFFGIPTATITATHHLARMSGAVVIPFHHHRLPGTQGHVIRLAQPLQDFPSADPVADTTRINASIEAMVREAPEQYLWIHKRFKTRPPASPPVY